MKIQNPHDKFFKETFSKIEVARDFMNNYLPQSIINIVDLNTLELQKDSFINEELQEVFSDMLFRVKINKREGYVYFLFEHKSYTSRNISFQLLKYMLEIWEAKVKKENSNELPIVLPLVIYHGSDEWNIKTTLGEMITGYKELPEEVKKYVPDYEYLLYDLSRYTDEEIKGEVQLRILITIFRDVFTKDNKAIIETVLRAAEHLGKLEDQQTGIEYFETFLRYILNAGQKLTKEDIEDIIRKVETSYPEGSEVVMTLAEQYREEGELRGELRGETKALTKAVIRLLTKKFGKVPEEIKNKISKLDADVLEVIIDSIFDYEKIDDVEKYL
jgi:predicted transposase/invertase (TIGR01784 family)